MDMYQLSIKLSISFMECLQYNLIGEIDSRSGWSGGVTATPSSTAISTSSSASRASSSTGPTKQQQQVLLLQQQQQL